jgi:hypothetical protein
MRSSRATHESVFWNRGDRRLQAEVTWSSLVRQAKCAKRLGPPDTTAPPQPDGGAVALQPNRRYHLFAIQGPVRRLVAVVLLGGGEGPERFP